MNPKIIPSNPILLVDDEDHFLLSAELTISSNGIKNIETCSDSSKVMDLLEKKDYSLVVLDINMPHLSGLDLLPALLKGDLNGFNQLVHGDDILIDDRHHAIHDLRLLPCQLPLALHSASGFVLGNDAVTQDIGKWKRVTLSAFPPPEQPAPFEKQGNADQDGGNAR